MRSLSYQAARRSSAARTRSCSPPTACIEGCGTIRATHRIMRRTRLATTATTMMMTRIERERAVSSHQVVPDRRHLGNRAPAPLDGYYPGNIVVRLLLGR